MTVRRWGVWIQTMCVGLGVSLLCPTAFASTLDVETLLNDMSLEQKLAQMLVVGVPKDGVEPIQAGGVIFLGNQLVAIDEVSARIASLQARAPVPLFIAADVEGGKVNRLVRHPTLTDLPSALSMAQGSVAQTRQWGEQVGKVMRATGLNCNLAPVLDVASEGLMRESERSFGSDVDQVAAHGRAFSLGLRAQGVAAIGKHFPGYGSTHGNSDHALLTDTRSLAEISHDMAAFQKTGDALAGVMLTNLAFEVYEGVPAPFSAELVRMAHAHGWLVITDDLAIPMLTQATQGDSEEVIRRAFLSGADLLLTTWPVPSEKAPDYVGTLALLIQEQPELESRVNASVRRILEAKRDLGLTTDATL